MKNKYTKIRIAHIFVEKTGPTLMSYFLVYAFFIFQHGGDHSNQTYVSITAFFLLINAIIRYWGLYLYKIKKISLNKIFIQNKIQIVLNTLGWMLLLLLTYFPEKIDNIGSILTTLVSFTLIANSIYVLASVLWINLFYAGICIFPSVLKCFMLFKDEQNSKYIGFIVLQVVYLFYVYRHAIRLRNEEIDFYNREYDFKNKIQELNKAKKEIESFTLTSFHNARLTSLGEMSSSIAHEINNPLTIISSHSQSLLKRTSTIDQNDLDKIYKINSAAERISKIIKTMKIFSAKPEINEVACYKLNSIIEETLSLCLNRIKNLDINLNVKSDELKIEGNYVQISQIILNLVNNAIDAIEESQDITKLISIESYQKNKNVYLRITNSGPLISDKVEEKLFTPFFTTKALGKGTGLGLSISKKLAENNHGQLKYEKHNNQNSFLIILKSS